MQMSIETPGHDDGSIPIPARPDSHRRSREEEAALKKFLDKQLAERLIEPCRSPYSAVPMLVRKADWTPENPTYRCVLDYRALNLATVKDTYPLPNVYRNLVALGKANLFTTCDLLQGFHQVELTDAAKIKTTHDLSQHGVQPPLLLQPPVLALPAPQAETQGRRHFRSRTTAPAEPPTPPPTPPTLVAPAPPTAVADAAPPSPVPLLIPADSTEPVLALPQPVSPHQSGVVPYPFKEEEPSNDDDLELPSEAKLVNNQWTYGVRKPTKRGYVTRWYPAKHFLHLELESEHFESLRSAASPKP